MFQAAVAQKNKAAGPDGWSGTELALFPFPMWQDLTSFVWWDRLECFPEPWQNVFQVHIPKTGGCSLAGQQAPADQPYELFLENLYSSSFFG